MINLMKYVSLPLSLAFLLISGCGYYDHNDNRFIILGDDNIKADHSWFAFSPPNNNDFWMSPIEQGRNSIAMRFSSNNLLIIKEHNNHKNWDDFSDYLILPNQQYKGKTFPFVGLHKWIEDEDHLCAIGQLNDHVSYLYVFPKKFYSEKEVFNGCEFFNGVLKSLELK
jgi:hypothetical protein